MIWNEVVRKDLIYFGVLENILLLICLRWESRAHQAYPRLI